jgi:2'-hydroxyisoflavone reductase
MPTSRRDFVKSAAASLGALQLAMTPGMAAARVAPRRPARALRILILGGTGFIGPHQVTYALKRGHDITLFNRGRSNPGLFPTVTTLIGDRATGDYESLKGKTWDAVIDNSSSDPEWTRAASQLLKDAAGQYLFISTRSVYRDLSNVPATNKEPVYTPETTPNWKAGDPMPYGLRKALAEQEAMKAFGSERTTIVRPGLIVGPGDNTDRFTYWPVRIVRGGEVLAPGDGSDPVQVIDARDVSEWAIRLCEQKDAGVFNAVGPRTPRSFAEFLYGIKAATTSECTFTWVDTDFLLQHDVRPYREMPVWRPARGEFAGFARFDLTPEVERGLTFRPLAVTTMQTLEWYDAQSDEVKAELGAGISEEREKEVLQLWKARVG